MFHLDSKFSYNLIFSVKKCYIISTDSGNCRLSNKCCIQKKKNLLLIYVTVRNMILTPFALLCKYCADGAHGADYYKIAKSPNIVLSTFRPINDSLPEHRTFLTF